VTFAYLTVFVGMTLLYFTLERLQRGGMSFEGSASLAGLIVSVTFPALLLAIVFSIFVLLGWKTRVTRLVLLSTSLLMQVLYLVNLVIVSSGGEVISI